MRERYLKTLHGIIPVSESESKQELLLIVSVSFNFDEKKVRQSPLAELFREDLVLTNEDYPLGKGLINALYDPNTKKLRHLCVGRIISDEETEDKIYLGLRYTPSQSRNLRFDSWPPGLSPLKKRIPCDHLITGNPLFVSRVHLLNFARKFGVKSRFNDEGIANKVELFDIRV